VRVANTRWRYQQVDGLREQGLSMRTIARRLDVNFKTVRRYVRAASVDALLAGGVQASVLDPFKPYLNDRLAHGERNATRLLAEITGQRGTPAATTPACQATSNHRMLDAYKRSEPAAPNWTPPSGTSPDSPG
jgi:transposase-like protein